MRALDRYTIESIGIPSIVLMEHAAMEVVSAMEGCLEGQPSILVVSGTGNNGADGLAAARLLRQKGCSVSIALVGDQERSTPEWRAQRVICEHMGIPELTGPLTAERISVSDFTVIVDAIFGTGLSRPVSGEALAAIAAVNAADAVTVSVDIPSGVSADTGAIMGSAVHADLTVALQAEKLGMALYPGHACCGRIVIRDIGIEESNAREGCRAYTLGEEDLDGLPSRPEYSNKGTFGRLLIAAGSVNMAGAAYLSGLAAYRSGAGLVRILTVEENREILQTLLPEAILTTYKAGDFSLSRVEECCSWATAVVIGPGLGRSASVDSLLNYFLQYAEVPMVLDADAINILAANPGMLRTLNKNVILTPHMGEMSRLTGVPIAELKKDIPAAAREFAAKYGCTLVLKDARTVAADPSGRIYVNTCGNSGMATGGSGDVLSGVIGGMLAEGLPVKDAAVYGVLRHSLAGDEAAELLGGRAMIARDIAWRLN